MPVKFGYKRKMPVKEAETQTREVKGDEKGKETWT